MTWKKIALKDFRDAVQSRALWALVGVFVAVSLASSYAYVELPEMFGEPEGATYGGLILFTVGLLGLFIPLASIVVCYKSIAGERESGSVKLLLALPTTRTNVLIGKIIGRSGVMLAGLGTGAVVGMLFGALLIGRFELGTTLALLLMTMVFIIAYVSIVVNLSALTGSTSRATTYALGFFVIAELLWDVVPLAILYVLGGFSMPTDIPDWGFALMQLSPSTAYFSAVIATIPESANGAIPDTGVGVDATTGESLFILPEFGYIVLAFWIIIPAIAGYMRMNAADL